MLLTLTFSLNALNWKLNLFPKMYFSYDFETIIFMDMQLQVFPQFYL